MLRVICVEIQVYESALRRAGDQVDDTLKKVHKIRVKDDFWWFHILSSISQYSVFQIDSAMKQLENRLDATGMIWTVNVVIVFDHGMTSGHNPPEQVNIREVKLSDYNTEQTRLKLYCTVFLH